MTTAAGSVLAFPSTREEAWRYTPVDEIVARLEAATVPEPGEAGSAVSPAIVDALAGDHGGLRLVFVNGAYRRDLSRDAGPPPGVWCGVGRQPGRGAAPMAEDALDAFGVRNRMDGRDAAVVVVDDGVHIDQPVHIVHVAAPGHGGPPVVAHPRTIIDVGADSGLAVIETYCGLDGAIVTNAATTLRVGDHAELDHDRVQTESPAATHVGHTRIGLGAGAHVRMSAVTVGGDIARNAIEVQLGAPDARVELRGVNVTGGSQRHDTAVTIDHAASGCVSRQRFAGVVDDHGRGSFSGEVIVQPGTVANDADQSTRNLLLDRHAEADARPWLRILADDVRCTHGATVGRLDDEALWYLRSRGIPVAVARTMLIDAFIRDITDAIPHASLRDHVSAVIAARRGARR